MFVPAPVLPGLTAGVPGADPGIGGSASSRLAPNDEDGLNAFTPPVDCDDSGLGELEELNAGELEEVVELLRAEFAGLNPPDRPPAGELRAEFAGLNPPGNPLDGLNDDIVGLNDPEFELAPKEGVNDSAGEERDEVAVLVPVNDDPNSESDAADVDVPVVLPGALLVPAPGLLNANSLATPDISDAPGPSALLL
jgi:hypothetical protein